MTTETIFGYPLTLYGFKGNRWVSLHASYFGLTFYYRMYEEFKLSDITRIEPIWYNPIYAEDLKEYVIYTDTGPHHPHHPYQGDHPLPTTNYKLYELVDIISDILPLYPSDIEDDIEYDVDIIDKILVRAAKLRDDITRNNQSITSFFGRQ